MFGKNNRGGHARFSRVAGGITSFVLSCCLGTLALVGAANAGTFYTNGAMTVAGHARTFGYYVPSSVNTTKGVTIILHGVSGSGASVEAAGLGTQWNAVADAQGILTIYPDGKPETSPTDSNHVWNDCRDDVDTSSIYYTDWDDVAFINALIAWASSTYNVDTTRVYLVGHSNGSMMAMRYALEAPTIGGDVVPAAITAIAGNVPAGNDNHTPSYNKCAGYTAPYSGMTMPILLVKGDADPVIPYGSTSGADHSEYCIGSYNSAGQCLGGAVKSYYDTLAFWQWKNGLSSSSTTVVSPSATTNYADYVSNCTSVLRRSTCDGSTAVKYAYGSSPNQVTYLRLVGGGHSVPQPDVESILNISITGWTNRDKYDGGNYLGDLMWNYMSAFHR